MESSPQAPLFMVLKRTLVLLACLFLFIVVGNFLEPEQTAPHFIFGQVLSLNLRRGPFNLYNFPAKTKMGIPSAIILFGSGDGGWGPWEDTVSGMLQENGYQVIGIDSAEYAKGDYDLATLQADDTKIVQTVTASYGQFPPLIMGGWSMGAAQAVAAAGGPNPPPRLIGLALVAQLSRARYGLRWSDRLNILPTGPGTFGIADFARTLPPVRLVQWHAAFDLSDSTDWLKKLTVPHREYDFADSGHDYDGASPVFLREFLKSVEWIMGSGSTVNSTVRVP
jgi:phosphatidylglycerol lysyltransferase